MDVKCPGSGESHRIDWANLDRLRPHDEVKFVIKDREDYDFAREVVARYDLTSRVHGRPLLSGARRDGPRQLSEWVLADRLTVRVQLQLHKYIWDPATRGV